MTNPSSHHIQLGSEVVQVYNGPVGKAVGRDEGARGVHIRCSDPIREVRKVSSWATHH